jgi:MFS family permease
MNERCSHCGAIFGRGEPGYFLGAMYFSYGIGIVVITVFAGLLYLVFPSWRLWQLVAVAWLAFLPLVPITYRYSRVLWLHFDRAIDPEDDR